MGWAKFGGFGKGLSYHGECLLITGVSCPILTNTVKLLVDQTTPEDLVFPDPIGKPPIPYPSILIHDTP